MYLDYNPKAKLFNYVPFNTILIHIKDTVQNNQHMARVEGLAK